MQCPVCDDRMKEVERLGVSIDICPGCKGVWLDRGELDKLLELSRQAEVPGAVVGATPRPAEPVAHFFGRDPRIPSQGDHHQHGHDHDHDHDHDRHRDHDRDHDRPRFGGGEHDRGYGHSDHRRRNSWLGDIFGGDD